LLFFNKRIFDDDDWDTVGLEVLWSRASKTVSNKAADLELDALANGKPVKGQFLMYLSLYRYVQVNTRECMLIQVTQLNRGKYR